MTPAAEVAGPAPLDGIVVLDLGRFVAGPFCAFMLGSLGATVLRIEPPGGDPSWSVPPYYGADGSVSATERRDGDIALGHLKRGRNKRSVVLDINSDAGRPVFLDLVARADVLVENFRPSSLQRIGIDYPALAALNPRLVYCAISGYGPDGPRSDWPSMDIAIQAASGFMSRNGFPDGPPIKAGPTIGDQVPAVYAALGIFAALRQREHTGRGQLVDVAMNDVMTSLVWDDHLDWYAQRGLGERWGNADPRGGPLNVYQASDGWVAIVVSSDAQWAGLCRLMDRDDLLAATPTSADRRRELPDLDDAVRRWCGTRPAEQVANALREVGIAGARVASALEARQDPQVASRRMLRPLRRSDAPSSDSGFVGTALPVHFGGYEPVHEPAEPLGNSTASVLSEFLGLGEEELSRLKRKGVIQH